MRSSASVARIFALWYVRGARDEHDARRLAAIGDENVVQPGAGERRLERQPQRRRADRAQRKIHQRTPLSASDSRLTTAASEQNGAVRVRRCCCHVVCQLTLRANSTSAAMIAALSARRRTFARRLSSCVRREGRIGNPAPSRRSTMRGTACAVCIRSPSGIVAVAIVKQQDRARSARPRPCVARSPRRRDGRSPRRRATSRRCAGRATARWASPTGSGSRAARGRSRRVRRRRALDRVRCRASRSSRT